MSTRIDPKLVAGHLPRLVSPNATPVIQSVGATSGWRLVGLELAGTVDTLVLLAEAFQGLGQTSKTLSVYKELAKIYTENGEQSRRGHAVQPAHLPVVDSL